jgi:plastocyanin
MRIFSTLCAVTALAVAGCGSSGNDKTTGGGSGGNAGTGVAETSTEASNDTASAPGEVTIKMKGIQFDPKQATVKVGQTVKWVNEDSVQHNVVAESGATSKSPTFGKGGSYTRDFTRPVEVKYQCTLHPGMEGTITVQ